MTDYPTPWEAYAQGAKSVYGAEVKPGYRYATLVTPKEWAAR